MGYTNRTHEISNQDDVIDSRNVIKRIVELEEWRDEALTHLEDVREEIKGLEEKAKEAEEAENEENSIWTAADSDRLSVLENAVWKAEDGTEYGECTDWGEDEHEEWRLLKAFADKAEGYAEDWLYGATLIRDSYFKEYAQQLAEDLGLMKNCDQWPGNCIDWEQAAEELKQDYSSVEFDGVTYWMR